MGGIFKGPNVPDVIKPPRPPDEEKARLDALAYAETQRRLKRTSGRQGSILTGPVNPFLGQ